MKDLYHDFRSTAVLRPITVSAGSGNGTGTDLLGYEGCLMVCHVGASGGLLGGSNYVTIQFLESSNNTVFSAIADTDLIGGNNTHVINANANANTSIQRTYTGSARYVTVTVANTGGVTLPVAAEVIKGFPIHAPIA